MHTSYGYLSIADGDSDEFHESCHLDSLGLGQQPDGIHSSVARGRVRDALQALRHCLQDGNCCWSGNSYMGTRDAQENRSCSMVITKINDRY